MTSCPASFIHGVLAGPFLWAAGGFLLIVALAIVGDALERLAR